MRELLLYLLLFHIFCGGEFFKMKFFNDDEIGQEHEIRHPRDQKEVCNEDTLMNFLAEIQVINPESVMKLATLSEIEPTCKKVSENLQKIKDYVKTCQPENQPDLYMQLIKGVESLHEKLCTVSNFRLKFEKIYQCAHELKNDYEECGGPADWNENSNNDEVCRAYKDIADCYYIKTAKVCGKSAAATVKELLESIIDSILVVSCNNIKPNPEVEDAMPEEYMKKLSVAPLPSRVSVVMVIGGAVTATITLSIFFL